MPINLLLNGEAARSANSLHRKRKRKIKSRSRMNLGEDVVFQILLKLPVRPLLRFRCVCKGWCALIKSCGFKDAYLALRRAMAVDDQVVGIKRRLVSDIPYEDMDLNSVLLAVDGDGLVLQRRLLNDIGRNIYTISVTCWSVDYQTIALSALAPSSSCNDFEISGNYSGDLRIKMGIINHVDGIVCFINGVNWFDISLVNPALRETRKLPIPTFNLGGFKCRSQGYGFGYGYDVVSDDIQYKVVAIVTVFEEDGFRSPYKHIALVYYLSTHSWKILGDMSAFVPPFVCFPSDECVFSHGSIHWCMQTNHAYDPQDRILAFDMTNESFRVIQFPHGWRYYTPHEDDAMYPNLFNVDKSTIALVYSTNQLCEVQQQLQVWVMKEYGDRDSWTKQYSISTLPRFSRALSFWKKDKLLLLSEGGRLMCYDLLKGQLDEPEQRYPLSTSGIRELQLVTGHETLVSVKQV